MAGRFEDIGRFFVGRAPPLGTSMNVPNNINILTGSRPRHSWTAVLSNRDGAGIVAALYRPEVSLIWFRRGPLRQATVALCVAVSFVLANQSYVALMDRIEHVLDHEHVPNPLAGEVYHCGHDHGHHHDLDDHSLCWHDDYDADDPLAHEHLNTTIVYLLAVGPAVVRPSRKSAVYVPVPVDPGRMYPDRLERPPKDLGATGV